MARATKAAVAPVEEIDEDDDLFEDETDEVDEAPARPTKAVTAKARKAAPVAADDDEDDDELFDSDEDDDEDDEDEFDTGGAGWVKMDDLKGRLLLCFPTGHGKRDSNLNKNQEYGYIEGDVHVLSGRPEGLIDAVPYVLEEFQLHGANVYGKLKPQIRKRRPYLGVLSTQPSKRGQDAWIFEEPNERQKAVAKRYLRELRRKGGDPFDS